VKVNITELDIDVLPAATRGQGADVTLQFELQTKLNPYAGGLPDSTQQALAKRYAELFLVFLKHKSVIDRVTFWGLTVKDSWLNNWPVRGRTSHPLLFVRNANPKPAFDAVVQTSRARPASR
jgi:endo-1,4-beta-xylanase